MQECKGEGDDHGGNEKEQLESEVEGGKRVKIFLFLGDGKALLEK